MGKVSVVANAKISQVDRDNPSARCFKSSRLWKDCQLGNICSICWICKMCNLIEPPARSLYTTIGPGGSWASTSRITENMEFILPPERRIKSEKSNDGGGCLDMGCCTIGCPVGGILSLSGLSSCSCGSSSSSLESSYPVNRIDVIMEFILRKAEYHMQNMQNMQNMTNM